MTPSPVDPVPSPVPSLPAPPVPPPVPSLPLPPLHAAVFASGGGSNFQALLDHTEIGQRRDPGREDPGGQPSGGQPSGGPPSGEEADGEEAAAGEAATADEAKDLWRCSLLVCDRPDAGVLARAERATIPTRVIPVAHRDSREVAEEILVALESAGIQLLLLAGYLRLVPSQVVRAFRGRILNVHPSLLPAFGGKGMHGQRIHEAVLAHGVRVTGVTVHLVDEEYDRGRILAQWPVPVLPGDDPERLATRVLEVEHCLYPRVADHLARSLLEGREPTPMVTPPLPIPSV